MFVFFLDYFGFKYELYVVLVFYYKIGSFGLLSYVIFLINIENEIWIFDVGFGFYIFLFF